MNIDAICTRIKKDVALQWEVKGRGFEFSHKLREGEAGSTETAVNELIEATQSLPDGQYVITFWGDGALRRNSAPKLTYYKNDSGGIHGLPQQQLPQNGLQDQLTEMKVMLMQMQKDREIDQLKRKHADELRALEEKGGDDDGMEKFSKVLTQISGVLNQANNKQEVSGRQAQKQQEKPQAEINGTEDKETGANDLEKSLLAVHNKLGGDDDKFSNTLALLAQLEPETLEALQNAKPATIDNARQFI